jgi:hypothetical protein
MGKNIDKRVWGVLGKQQTYFSPQKQVEGKTKTPLNANAFDSWDAKRSRFKRVDGYENPVQQAGTVIGQSQPTPQPSATPQPTPSITPTSTPLPILTPDLWFDATDSSTMFLVLSGGTTFVDKWTSKGNYTWELSASTINRRPVLSGSSLMPSNQQVVRFNTNNTSTLQDGLSGFNQPVIPHSGSTTFVVFAKPQGSTYNNSLYQFQLYSGFTNGGVAFVSGTSVWDRYFSSAQVGNLISTNAYTPFIQNMSLTGFTGTNINDKFLMKAVNIYPTGFSTIQSNETSGTSTNSFSGISYEGRWNNAAMGITITTSAGTQNFNNMNMEMGEVMIYNRNLSAFEQAQVEAYLKDKWQYDLWSIPPTPQPTPTPTATPIPPSLSFIVGSGATGLEACNNLASGNTTTLYAYDLGNCGPCAPATCWPCLTTSQPIYQNAQGTILAASAFYANQTTPSTANRMFINNGFISGGTYTSC